MNKTKKCEITMLSNRQSEILKIIIEQYTKTGLPVASKTIQTVAQLDCSSATIRNECVFLENAGLLEKSHSSSGRIPATKGYRYYVDNLMAVTEDYDLFLLKRRIKDIFNRRDIEISDVIKQTSDILSEMTQLVSIGIGPNWNEDSLKKIELLAINPEHILAIIITNEGHVENKNFHVKNVDFSDLQLAADLFNQRLVGTKIIELKEKLLLLAPILEKQVKQSEEIIQGFINALINFSKPLASTHGIQYMLDKPEFNDINKVKALIQFIESQTPWNYFNKLSQKQVQIRIGEELGGKNNDVAMITTTFKIHDHERGQIAIVGPKRLEYEKISEILTWINDTIKDKFS